MYTWFYALHPYHHLAFSADLRVCCFALQAGVIRNEYYSYAVLTRKVNILLCQMARDNNECRCAAPTLTDSSPPFLQGIYLLCKWSRHSVKVGISLSLPSYSWLISTALSFATFLCHLPKCISFFRQGFSIGFYFHLALAAFPAFPAAMFTKYNFCCETKFRHFCGHFSPLPISHTHTRTLHCYSLWVLLVVLSSLCVCLCVWCLICFMTVSPISSWFHVALFWQPSLHVPQMTKLALPTQALKLHWFQSKVGGKLLNM